jgi:hypothetical protein
LRPFFLEFLRLFLLLARECKPQSAQRPPLIASTVARSWQNFSANPTTKFRNLAKNSAIFLAFCCYVIKSCFGNKKGSFCIISAE